MNYRRVNVTDRVKSVTNVVFKTNRCCIRTQDPQCEIRVCTDNQTVNFKALELIFKKYLLHDVHAGSTLKHS